MTKKSSASCSLAANPEIERELDLDAWQNVEKFFKKEKRRGLDSSLVKTGNFSSQRFLRRVFETRQLSD